MEIRTSFKSRMTGEDVEALYKDVDNIRELDGVPVHGATAVCFYNDKLVLVYEKDKGRWNLPGGGVDGNESVEEAVIREVREETNMRVIKQAILGLQINTYPSGEIFNHSRSVCLVEPYGPFVADPAGDVTEIKLIDPADFRQYYNWGANSDRMMEVALKKIEELKINE